MTESILFKRVINASQQYYHVKPVGKLKEIKDNARYQLKLNEMEKNQTATQQLMFSIIQENPEIMNANKDDCEYLMGQYSDTANKYYEKIDFNILVNECSTIQAAVIDTIKMLEAIDSSIYEREYNKESPLLYANTMENILLTCLTTLRALVALNIDKKITEPLSNGIFEHVKCLGVCCMYGR